MFKIIGGVIGFFMGSFLGIFGMIIGAVIGSSLGRSVDSLLFGSRENSSGKQGNQDAYRKFYEQFYQNTKNREYNTGYGNSEFGFDNFQTGAPDRCYTNLGCSRSDSNDDIKRHYRKMVSLYHPDRIAGKGLSETEMNAAEAKFKILQESYNQIKKEKGI